MPTMLLYGFMALAILGAVGGIGYKVRESGKDSVRVEWAAANAKAQADAEADRKRQDDLRQAQDKEATRRLTNEKKRSGELMASLESHIRASGAAAQCAVPEQLRNDWNGANAGPQGVSPGTVPPRSPTTPPAR